MRKRKKYENIESLISQGMEIKGQIFSSVSIRVDGNIEGELDVKGDVWVGEKGKIKGNVKVENIMIAGTIEGNVQARGRFEINSTGVVHGDVISSIITIDEGAVLEGTTKMTRPNRGADNSQENKIDKEKKLFNAMSL